MDKDKAAYHLRLKLFLIQASLDICFFCLDFFFFLSLFFLKRKQQQLLLAVLTGGLQSTHVDFFQYKMSLGSRAEDAISFLRRFYPFPSAGFRRPTRLRINPRGFPLPPPLSRLEYNEQGLIAHFPGRRAR